MTLTVLFMIPGNPTAQKVTFRDIQGWKTDHGELHIQRPTRGGSRTIAVFANHQWIWAQEPEADQDLTEEAEDKTAFNYPSIKESGPSRRKSDLSDLALPDAESIARARAASVEFAIDNRAVPWSEAHMRAVKEYEDAVRREYGDEAVLNLPWNKVPRGSNNGVYR